MSERERDLEDILREIIRIKRNEKAWAIAPDGPVWRDLLKRADAALAPDRAEPESERKG